MPIKIQYLENGGVLAKGEGTITGSDVLKMNEEFYDSEEKIKKISYQIIDLTSVVNVNANIDDLKAIAHQDKKAFAVNPDMLIAVISDRDIIYGFARIWEMRSESPALKTQVFRRHEDARRWIHTKLRKSIPRFVQDS